jgi:predicted DNA-binding transcriptional regulator AlpA
MLRIKDVMVLFGVSRTTVYKWMKSGMPHVYIGKLLFFDKVQLLDWVQCHAK